MAWIDVVVEEGAVNINKWYWKILRQEEKIYKIYLYLFYFIYTYVLRNAKGKLYIYIFKENPKQTKFLERFSRL